MAALAVVMDDTKRVSTGNIAAGIAKAACLARDHGAKTLALPDMTEDLLRQPRWVTDEQRRETCRAIASAMIEGIARQNGAVPTVRIWVWQSATQSVWIEEFDRVAKTGVKLAPAAV